MFKALVLALCAGTLAGAADKSASSSKISNAPFSSAVKAITGRSEYEHANWGIAVADLQSGRMLYEINQDKLFAPASTTKLFSTAVALAALGPQYRFVTPVYRTGAIDSKGALNGDLVLRASGDPSLSGRIDVAGHLAWTNHDHIYAGFEQDATLTNTDVLSGLKDLAAQVAGSGIRQVHDVLIDDRLFDKAQGSGSGPSQLVPVVVNDNLFDVLTTPAATVGQPAKVTVRPVSQFAQFDTHVATVDAKQDSSLDVEEISPRRYTVRGQIALGHAPLLRVAEVSNPTDFARTLLIECLAQQGVFVERSVLAEADAQALPLLSTYPALSIVAKHTSPPFSEEVRVILKVSHNLGASLLPLLLAVNSGGRDLEAGMRREGVLLKQIGVDADAISFAGGAGGERADFVTPRSVIDLLRAMAHRSDFHFYHDALPVLGVDGTLFDAVDPASPVRGKAFAKTGTLVWDNTMDARMLLLSKAMSGYMMSASGRQLVFAIYLNNVGARNNTDIDNQAKTLGDVAELIYRSF